MADKKQPIIEEVDLGLGEDAVARIVVEAAWQQPCDEGDQVVVRAMLQLPTEHYAIHPELRFRTRCPDVALESLHRGWGAPLPGTDYRSQDMEFAADTWAEAAQMAQTWARGELRPLLEALGNRHRALEAAGPWPEGVNQDRDRDSEAEPERKDGDLWFEPMSVGSRLMTQHRGRRFALLHLNRGLPVDLIGCLPDDLPYWTEGGKLAIRGQGSGPAQKRKEGDLWLEPLPGGPGYCLSCWHSGRPWAMANFHKGEDGWCAMFGNLPEDLPYQTNCGRLVIKNL